MLDFRRIRGDTEEGRRSFFEQLVCRLARLNESRGEFRRIEGAGGDGGVEALRLLPSGKKVGYQAKYYPDRIDWAKLDASVQTALTQHPELDHYVIALPCDFTGRRAARNGSTEGEWGTWDDHAHKWRDLAATRGMSVQYEAWTAFELENALERPAANHLIPYFFEATLVFTRAWIERQLERTIHDLQARYSPDDHVDTESLLAFDLIYRRDNVRQDLRAVFNVASTANPRAAAALVPAARVPERELAAAEESLRQFVGLGARVDAGFPDAWPVCRWFASWETAARQLHKVTRVIRGGITQDDELTKRVDEISKAYELTRREVFGGRWEALLPIDGSRAALFVGRAGAGKSHVLARGAQLASSDGAPVIHLLGQHIVDDDPRVSIKQRLELTKWSFDDALAALDLAAETANTRALIVIDALNEGRGLEVWQNHIASFVREINAYERIVLVASCREEYLPYVLPEELQAQSHPYTQRSGIPQRDCEPLGKFVVVPVAGFRSTHEREVALRTFMDKKGIARPTAPVLDEEFFNPLFMSSVCRSMEKAGVKVFPRGLHGSEEIIDFMLKVKAKALGTPHDRTPAVYNALRQALDLLAGAMVDQQADHVPLREANDLVGTAFETLPLRGHSWLTALEGSDILRRDVEQPIVPASPLSKVNEVVRFSFQRLQDQMIAQRLANKCRDLQSAFGPGEPFAFLLSRNLDPDNAPRFKPAARWVGVLGALWSLFAERYQLELFDLASFFGGSNVECYRRDLRPVFRASIRERKGHAFTRRTSDLLNHLWEEHEQEKLEILLSTSCVPGHAWNANLLVERLFSLPKENRMAVWSRHFAAEYSQLVERAAEIADWAVHVDVRIAHPEVIFLAGLTLGCLSIAANDTIRHNAALGLANLLASQEPIFEKLVGRFGPDETEVRATLAAAQAIHKQRVCESHR